MRYLIFHGLWSKKAKLACRKTIKWPMLLCYTLIVATSCNEEPSFQTVTVENDDAIAERDENAAEDENDSSPTEEENATTGDDDQPLGEGGDNPKELKQVPDGGDGSNGEDDRQQNTTINDDGSRTVYIDAQSAIYENYVTVVFLLDTSGSMVGSPPANIQEKEMLEDVFADFANQFQMTIGSQANYEIHMIGENFTVTADLGYNFFLTDDGSYRVYSRDSLAVFSNYMENFILPYRNAADLESEVFEVIAVTDDDLNAGSMDTFENFMAANPILDGKVKINGIVGKVQGADPQLPWCNIVRTGDAYEAYAAATGGFTLNLCSENWNALIDNLAQKILANIIANTYLVSPEAGKTIAEIRKLTVDGVEMSSPEHYTFKYETSTLIFQPDSIPNPDSEIIMTYLLEQ